MIKNIIFDVHKVLRILNNDTLENYLPEKMFAKYKTRYAGIMSKDYIKRVYHNTIFTTYDLGLIERDDLIVRLSEKYNEPLEVVRAVMDERLSKNRNVIFDKMIKFIKELRRAGYKTFILSNMGEDMARVLTEMIGAENFDDILFSCDAHFVKPDPQIYNYALSKFEIKAEESLFIDDYAENLVPFKALGGKTYLFDYTKMDLQIEEIKNLIKNS